MKKLNFDKMVKDIDKVIRDNDGFLFEMECKKLPNKRPYTQDEASRMEELLGKIYLISHCTTCEACQIKYLTNQ